MSPWVRHIESLTHADGFARFLWLILALASLFALPWPVHGCTLFAACGGPVGEKGTLLAKNRDNTKGLVTELRFVDGGKGIPFVGLFDPEADGFVVAGINAKGLCVVNASAASLSKEKREVATEDLTERILRSFASAEGVAQEVAMFAGSHPAFYMAADARQIVLIEVAPGGKTSVRATENGVLTHTNHYVDKKLLSANERPTSGSARRLARINLLMDSAKPPLDLDRFILFSEDKGGALSDGVKQECSPSRKVCTLASWAIFLPKNGFPELYVKIEKADNKEEVKRLTLDSAFWTGTTGVIPFGTGR